MYHHHKGQLINLADWHEVLERIVRQFAVNAGADGAARGSYQERVPIGLRPYDGGCADIAARSGSILHHYRLFPGLGEFVRYQPCDDVQGRTWRQGKHHPDRPARISLAKNAVGPESNE